MLQEELSPVSVDAPESEVLTNGIGLCLSGGGYRAMLFHLGVLWRLAEIGYLGSHERHGIDGPIGSLQRVSSVSGGSITAGLLGVRWNQLKVDEEGFPDRFRQLVAQPIQAFASQTTVSLLSGLWALAVSTIGKSVVRSYRKHLFGDLTLQDLPDSPDFVLNATNLQSGALWRFSRHYARDWRVGEIKSPSDSMAAVVGASSAFPPFLSPARFKYEESDYTPGSGADLQVPPYTTRPNLSDGGVYDNMGLETVFKQFKTIIVSNAGGKYQAEADIPRDWVRQSYRVMETIDNQVRSLRKRALLSSLKSKARFGVYWSIRSDIDGFPAENKLPCPHARTLQLARIKTDLAEKDQATQRQLINWGYALCDAGIRSWVEKVDIEPPTDFPYPAEKV